MTLRIVGTGFGRTGTDSMRKALNLLGFGPTHHMHEMGKGSNRQNWLELVKGAEPQWDNLFAGYHACVDWPSAFYWPQLIDAYPDAKVLLTMRSAESWWASFEATILRNIVEYNNPEDAIKIYKRNIDEVLATVAPERLLVHTLGDGWEPLCHWLDCPAPNIDYPQGNTTKDFMAKLS